jgi:hypothetical protein
MQAKEKLEKPLNWFILPSESSTWDVILEKYAVEEFEPQTDCQEADALQPADDCFDKDYITCKRRKRRDHFYY